MLLLNAFGLCQPAPEGTYWYPVCAPGNNSAANPVVFTFGGLGGIGSYSSKHDIQTGKGGNGGDGGHSGASGIMYSTSLTESSIPDT